MGIVLGALAVYYWHARLHGGYKRAVFTGFALIVIYQCFMYFLIDPRMNIEWLYLPTLLRGAGYVMIYISLTVYISGFVPFQHFFQVLSLLGFVRTGFRFGIRKCDLRAGDATRSTGKLPIVSCRSGCGESYCRSYPNGTALWRDDEAGDAGQHEGIIWLDVYYRDFLFADAFELQVSEPEHGGTFTRNEAIKRVMKRNVSY